MKSSTRIAFHPGEIATAANLLYVIGLMTMRTRARVCVYLFIAHFQCITETINGFSNS